MKMTTKPHLSSQPPQSKAPRSKYALGLLRTTIITGSLLATIMGAQLLAQNEAATTVSEATVNEIAFTSSAASSSDTAAWAATLQAIPTVASTTQIALDDPISNTATLTAVPTLQPVPEIITPSTEQTANVTANDVANVTANDTAAVLSFQPQTINPVQVQAPVTRSRSSR